ncbi:MAG: uroporphyrinogen decarboxylase [Deltaproteobacteria bacterium]|nr:uroporphyrinogen decarboxylase [Deltaproteobacteria bacterium]
MSNIFQLALERSNINRPPVWFMRQAGRYHTHYQQLRQKYSFMDLCKKPELACEVTLGPVEDFGFDAAILFSDLLFPLEVMGMGLQYNPSPKLDWHLHTLDDLKKLKCGDKLVSQLDFQAEAIGMIRNKLRADVGLLGFVGGPLTLFYYAINGTLQNKLTDGIFAGFAEKLLPLLADNMIAQAKAGVDAIAVFDTSAGEIDLKTYKDQVLPVLKVLLERFKHACPNTPVIYYAKGIGHDFWEELKSLPIACLGIDWRHDIAQTLSSWHQHFAIQGNMDPSWLLLTQQGLEIKLRHVFMKIKQLPLNMRKGWICGLGHGVLPNTPDYNIRLFIKLQKEIFADEICS